jgi:hypothetical protein
MVNPNPKPPRRKKKLGRHRLGNDRKESRFDHEAARASLRLPPTANAQEIASAATMGDVENPTDDSRAIDRSPLKREYKAMLLEERAKNELLVAQAEKAESTAAAKQRKISSLKEENKRLSEALRIEKEKSRLTVLELLDDAELVMSEANSIKLDADRKMSAAELALHKEKERQREHRLDSVQKEREYISYKETASKYDMCILFTTYMHY